MKKLLLTSAIIMAAGAARAADGVYVKGIADIGSYSGVSLDVKGTELFSAGITNFNTGASIGFAAGYDFNDIYSIEGSVSRLALSLEIMGGEASASLNSIEATGFARLAQAGPVDFNGLASIGWVYAGISVTDPYDVSMIDEGIHGFLFGLGVEAEYNATEHTAMALGLRWDYVTIGKDKIMGVPVDVSLGVNSFTLYGSLKYRF